MVTCLVEGVAAFGARSRVHYLGRGSNAPQSVDVVQDLQAQTLRRALLAHVHAHAYAAASALCAAELSFAGV